MKQKIFIEKGNEFRAYVQTELSESDWFWSVYERAMTILDEIVVEEEKFRKSIKNVKSGAPQYAGMGNNMIAFCAERGQGKTSVLQTIVHSLKNDSENLKMLKCKGMTEFYVLDTIDPSALENGESIVRVIISRLFYQLQQLTEPQIVKLESNFKEDKIRILKLFKNCYENIDYLKGNCKKSEYQDDLDYLSRLGDSARLKENLYELINLYMKLQSQNARETEQRLVIPIDDADLSMRNIFQLCEDIRRYLAIPNVIVLMATNYEQMVNVIYQDYLNQFDKLLQVEKGDAARERCYNMAVKYIEKILPESRCIMLPEIDKLLSQSPESVILEYSNKGDENSQEQFLNTSDNVQEQLLKLIYDKTGIVFLKPESGLHPFLPSTLREMTHFLKLFCDMKDVNMEVAYKGVWKEFEENKEVETEIRKLKTNLNIMRHYFINKWCLEKINFEEQNILLEQERLNREDLLQELLKEINSFIAEKKTLDCKTAIYVTILMNEWFANGLEYHVELNKICEVIDEYLNFSKFLDIQNHKSPVPIIDAEHYQYRNKYNIVAFPVSFSGLNNKDWLKENENENYKLLKMTLYTPNQNEQNGENILSDSEYRFQMFKPMCEVLKNIHLLNDEYNSNKKNSDKSSSLIEQDELKMGVEYNVQYLISLKNIMANIEVFVKLNNILENKIEDVISEDKNKRENKAASENENESQTQFSKIHMDIFGILDEWSKDFAKYLKIKSNISATLANLYNTEVFKVLFWANAHNRKEYLEEYKDNIKGNIARFCTELKKCMEKNFENMEECDLSKLLYEKLEPEICEPMNEIQDEQYDRIKQIEREVFEEKQKIFDKLMEMRSVEVKEGEEKKELDEVKKSIDETINKLNLKSENLDTIEI